MIKRVLIIGASDCSGGAGIQADIKSITALGGYAATAITAVTIQNTTGVFSIINIDPKDVIEQIKVTINDIGVDIIKIGMLHKLQLIEAIAEFLDLYCKEIPIVVDPVMISQSKVRLLEKKAIKSLVDHILPLATIITPNIPEAEVLSKTKILNKLDMICAIKKISHLSMNFTLLKGGHLKEKNIIDILSNKNKILKIFEKKVIISDNTHGTGCSLASAIAISLAQGMNIEDSIIRARDFVRKAIKTAPNYGKGNGPLNHSHYDTK